MKYLSVLVFIVGIWSLILNSTIVKADNIYLRNGHIYLNVQVVDTTSSDVLYMKQIVMGSTKNLTKHAVSKKDVLSIEYRELVDETSKEADWNIEQWKANASLQSIMPNATLVGFERRRPNLAIGLPLGLVSLIGGLVVLSNADAGEKDLVIAGAIESIAGIYFIAIALHTEDWAIYSNGAEIKVTLKLK